MVDIGSVGHNSDGAVFETSKFHAQLQSGALNIPQPTPLSNSALCGYYFAADAAFPLTTCRMKPYGGSNLQVEKKIFNYRY